MHRTLRSAGRLLLPANTPAANAVAGPSSSSCLRYPSWGSTAPVLRLDSSIRKLQRQREIYGRCCDHLSAPVSPRCVRRAHTTSPQRQPDTASTPIAQLRRLRQLILDVNATNSKLEKERTIAEYHDLRILLAFLYGAYSRMHLTSAILRRHLNVRDVARRWQHDVAPRLEAPSNRAQRKTKNAALLIAREQAVEAPATLLDLFRALASRTVTGNNALATVTAFLERHGILAEHKDALSTTDTGDLELDNRECMRKSLLKPTVLEIFMRCLDRNLQAGFGEKMLVQAFTKHASPSDGEDGLAPIGKGKARMLDGDAFDPVGAGMKASAFQAALGKTVTLQDLPSIFTPRVGEAAQPWYASRKLDGIRCIICVEFAVPSSSPATGGAAAEEPLSIRSIQTLSRTGRVFTTLGKVEADLNASLPRCPEIRQMVMQELRNSPHLCGEGVRIYLDGEACMLTKASDDVAEADPSDRTASDELMPSTSAAPPNIEQDSAGARFVENFRAVSGEIRRKDWTIRRPLFFPFDLLTEREFREWADSPTLVATHDDGRAQTATGYVPHRPFGVRIAALQRVLNWFASQPRPPSTLRQLDQLFVTDAEALKGLISTSLSERWEGLILRHAASTYKGKRTAHLLKLKQWQDAEYRIESVQVAPMRLSIAGEYRVCDAVASLTIRHAGTEVRVGSGLTTQQRLEWAKHPDKVVGKWCTVEYFEESRSIARDKRTDITPADGKEAATDGGGGASLRFPRIKEVWLDGERDV